MSQPSAEAAVVEIKLDGRTLVLTPTLRAARDINRQCGSLGEALRGVQLLNVEVMCLVVRVGAGLSEAEFDAVGEQVFRHGIGKLTGDTARFLTLLLNGGKEPAKDDEKKPESASLN